MRHSLLTLLVLGGCQSAENFQTVTGFDTVLVQETRNALQTSGAHFGVLVDPRSGEVLTLQRQGERAVTSDQFTLSADAVCLDCDDPVCSGGYERTIALDFTRLSGDGWVNLQPADTLNWTPLYDDCGAYGPCPAPIDASSGPAPFQVELTGALTTCTPFRVFFDTDDRSPYDLDGDGIEPPEDCDESNPDVPAALDDIPNGLDDDCDLEIDEDVDQDEDGYFQWEDCDDLDETVHPGMTGAEGVVDGIDNDCDGLIDDDVDQDGDALTPAQGDCDDTDPAQFPGADESVPDGLSNDCDQQIDEDVDLDGDGWTLAQEDCDDANPSVNPGSPAPDLDCDADNDGYRSHGFDRTLYIYDCDDADPSVNPDAVDGPSANGIDDDCDGLPDGDVDGDGDGFTPAEGDCLDSDPAIRPFAPGDQIGDGVDTNCSGWDGDVWVDGLGYARFVPAGSFEMGCDVDRDDPDDLWTCPARWRPVHQVQIQRNLRVQAFEVRQDAYEDLIGSDPSQLPGVAVSNVSWSDAVAFANAVNAAEGLPTCAGDPDPLSCEGWRLPTEAEWAYAARAGEDGPFASTSSNVGAAAHHRANSVSYPGGSPPRLRPWNGLGATTSNAFGLYDMSGNLGEWVSDWDGGFTFDALVDPIGPATGSERIVRGGSFLDAADQVRVASRTGVDPSETSYRIGFRLVRFLEMDVDHDEDGTTEEDGDCAPLDPAIHPAADESVVNGTDDDCDGDIDEDVP